MTAKREQVGADTFVAAGLAEGDGFDRLLREDVAYHLERHGDEFLIRWPAHKVECALSAIHENGEGIHAELAVLHGGVDLHWGRLGLSSTQAREGVVRKLNGIVGEVPWRTILETTCRRTAQAVRDTDPAVLLEARPRTWTRLLVAPIVESRGLTVLFADGGSGKGYLALLLSLAAAIGEALPGGIRPTGKVPVLYLDWESSQSDLEHRVAQLGRGLGIDSARRLHYRAMVRPLSEMVPALRAEVSRLGIGLVILDSWAPACGVEPEGSDSSIRTVTAARSLVAPCLAVAHVSKLMADQKGKTRPFGSVFLWNLARSCWEVKRSQDRDDASEMVVGLYHVKVNEGPRHAPFGLRFTFDPPGEAATTVGVEPCLLSSAQDLAEKLPLRQRIRGLLATGALTTEEIVEATGAPESQVAARLRELSKKQIVIKLDAGGGRGKQAKWGLAAS